MSRIITKLQCEKCGHTYDNVYISFGHPDNDFDWKWKCRECEQVNTELIKAMPMPHELGWIKLKE